MFLFQCYTGLAYADLSRFDWNKVEKRGDKYIYTAQRQKTGSNFYIVLLPRSIEILKKYNMSIPHYSVQYYTSTLHEIEKELGLKKRLTTHVARHTFATMCLNSDIKIEVLARMLGHSDIKTTQIYAKLYNSTIEKAFDKLDKNLSSGK